MTFKPINVTNLADLVGREDLVTKTGEKVEVIKSGVTFLVKIGSTIFYASDDNLAVGKFLDSIEIGTIEDVSKLGRAIRLAVVKDQLRQEHITKENAIEILKGPIDGKSMVIDDSDLLDISIEEFIRIFFS